MKAAVASRLALLCAAIATIHCGPGATTSTLRDAEAPSLDAGLSDVAPPPDQGGAWSVTSIWMSGAGPGSMFIRISYYVHIISTFCLILF